VVAGVLSLSAKLGDGSALETNPVWHIFVVERGAPVRVAPGRPADPVWIVLEWIERPEPSPPPQPPSPAPRRPAARVDDSLTVTQPVLASRRLAFLRVPNPARGPVRLMVEVPERGPAQLEVFDVQGRRVSRSDLGEREP